MVLNAIYEEDFLGFSYGFRPGRGPHDALDALVVGITSRKVNYILDADIRSFFDTVSQTMARPLPGTSDRRQAHHPPDPEMAEGGYPRRRDRDGSDRGTGQGSVISPLLANIYLHYVLDLWAERWRQREATGDMIIVRYADDVVAGFEHEDDARRFLDAMRERFEEFALSLHPEKTRLIEFGRHAAANREKRGLGKPETFNFLGFTFVCAVNRAGATSCSSGRSRRDRMMAKLQEIKGELRRRMHQPIPEQGEWLQAGRHRLLCLSCRADQLSRHSRPSDSTSSVLWRRTLRRRSQRDGSTWTRIEKLAARLPPQTAHPSSLAERTLRRQTPKVGAVCGKAACTDLCGGRPVRASLPRSAIPGLAGRSHKREPSREM